MKIYSFQKSGHVPPRYATGHENRFLSEKKKVNQCDLSGVKVKPTVATMVACDMVVRQEISPLQAHDGFCLLQAELFPT
jgi:hypothetical protein